MRKVLWFWSFSLASATCSSTFAIWIPTDRSMMLETLGQALLETDYDQISILNPGVNFNTMTVPGKEYKIPYHEDMALVPPASWSGGCPKQLDLGRPKFKESRSNDRPSTTFTTIMYDPSRSESIQSFPSADSFSAGLIPRARSVSITDGSTTAETPGIIESRTTPNAATGTATPMICREETHPSVPKFESSSESRAHFARSYCDRLQHITVGVANPIDPLPYGDTFIGIQVLPSCPNYSLGARHIEACRAIMENINRKCPRAGGIYSNGCVTYYLLRE